MNVSDFDYDLPEELIAQHPSEKRDESRLLVVNRESGEIKHEHFYDIEKYLRPTDCLVLNDSKVLPARLFGTKEGTGAKIEFLLTKRIEGDVWETMVRPGRRVHIGDIISFSDDFTFSNDNLRYTATWTRQGCVLLSVSFPVEYELISGENKIEAEDNILSDIKKTKVSHRSPLTTHLSENTYINGCFSNRLYYQHGKLISNSNHPAETLANMMLSTQARGQYDINVTQIS